MSAELTTQTTLVATKKTAFSNAITALSSALTTYNGAPTETNALLVDAAHIALNDAWSKWSKERRYLIDATVNDAIGYPKPGIRVGS